MTLRSDMADLIDLVRDWPGWRVEDRKDAVLIYPPDKEQGIITAHRTPSDHRAIANTKARLRRAGGPI